MTSAKNKTEQELVSIRDTVESIWIAIVLAFVLRAFMIEAFVIPTGSMAPRLMGEHYDLVCSSCGYEFAFGVADKNVDRSQKQVPPDVRCPNCDSRTVDPGFANGGDRVLVLKYLYQFRPPQPWDVVVFKNPQNNRENYIKRLIGVPGETIEIVHGDVFFKSGDDQPWQIRRKSPRAQETMWQIIYDNDYQPHDQPDDKSRNGPPPRWEAQGQRWARSENENGRTFRFTGGSTPGDLVFRANRSKFLPTYGYNSPSSERQSIDHDVDVCTDLNLSLVLVPSAPDSSVQLTLTSFDHEFHGLVRADGTVVLSHRQGAGAIQEWGRKTLQPLKIGQGTEVALTHVDFRVTLWIDGEKVLESTDKQYTYDLDQLRQRMLAAGLPRPNGWMKGCPPEHIKKWMPQFDRSLVLYWLGPAMTPEQRAAAERDENWTRNWLREISPEDLGKLVDSVGSPPRQNDQVPTPQVRLSASGSPSQLLHPRLMRDVYYTSPILREDYGGPETEYAAWLGLRAYMPGWGTTGHPLRLAKHPDQPDLDEFFVLGDNSPQSLDGRLWVRAAPTLRLKDAQRQPLYSLGTVPRYNMIGKAFFVYWPAGFRIPGLDKLAVLPNVGKMRLIR